MGHPPPVRVCPRCDRECPPSDTHCPQCGHPLKRVPLTRPRDSMRTRPLALESFESLVGFAILAGVAYIAVKNATTGFLVGVASGGLILGYTKWSGHKSCLLTIGFILFLPVIMLSTLMLIAAVCFKGV